MITNIFLGLILGVVIISFIILNNNINKLYKLFDTTIRKLNSINSVIDGINNDNSHLLDSFNERILVNNENYYNIITLLKSRFKDLDDATISIYSRLNVLDTDTQNHIIAEHRFTRKQIEKQAKISSKINSKRKQNNNTQK